MCVTTLTQLKKITDIYICKSKDNLTALTEVYQTADTIHDFEDLIAIRARCSWYEYSFYISTRLV